jgi:hypothetical protein
MTAALSLNLVFARGDKGNIFFIAAASPPQ